MDFSLTDVQKQLVEMVRHFVQTRIVPLEDDLDPDASELPREALEPLRTITRQMGLYNIDVPAEHGGPGLDTVTRTLLAMELSQHRAGLYTPCYGAFGGSGLAQLYDANDEQREKYLYPTLRGEKRGFFGLTEPAGGSDPANSIETKAVLDGDVWVLNGSKVFISDANVADYGLIFARTGGPGSGRAGITCFIVETDWPGFEVSRVIPTLRFGSLPTEIRMTDLRVPASNVLGEVGGGFSLANQTLVRNRIPYSAACVGVAMKAHAAAVEYAPQRLVFGKALADHQGIQWMLVDNEVDIRSAALLVLQAAHKADAGQPFRTETAIAKMVATEASARVVDRVMQIHGGYGVTKDFPFERWYRELRIRRIGEGSTETQRMIISRDILSGRGVKHL